MYLNTKEETSVAKQALYISKETSSKLSNSYNNNIVEILKFGNCYNLRNSETLSNEIISDIICKIKTKYIDFWKTKVETSKRLDFFKQFKQSFSPEPFLDSLNNFNIKRDYMKFRTSSHCLMVETGRYSRPKIKRENRICTLCNTKEVEDERHLIFHCNAYSELRKIFFDKIHSIVQLNPNDENSFIKTIFSTENAIATFFVANYISKCFEKRKDIIHQSYV